MGGGGSGWFIAHPPHPRPETTFPCQSLAQIWETPLLGCRAGGGEAQTGLYLGFSRAALRLGWKGQGGLHAPEPRRLPGVSKLFTETIYLENSQSHGLFLLEAPTHALLLYRAAWVPTELSSSQKNLLQLLPPLPEHAWGSLTGCLWWPGPGEGVGWGTWALPACFSASSPLSALKMGLSFPLAQLL